MSGLEASSHAKHVQATCSVFRGRSRMPSEHEMHKHTIIDVEGMESHVHPQEDG